MYSRTEVPDSEHDVPRVRVDTHFDNRLSPVDMHDASELGALNVTKTPNEPKVEGYDNPGTWTDLGDAMKSVEVVCETTDEVGPLNVKTMTLNVSDENTT